ncbi:IclR family transcriptional regulator domain-containing protein [Lacisediminihabitans sp. FW035]
MSDSRRPRLETANSVVLVNSFSRGLSVIRAFDADHAELSLSEVGRRASLPPAAARRFLHTLLALGYVRTEGRLFALTPRVLELGFSYLSALSLPDIVQPHLELLSRQVGQSVSAAVIDGTDIVYVARVPTKRIMNVRITIGTRFPAYATSTGRVLLSAMNDAELAAAIDASSLTALTGRTMTDPGSLRAELARVRDQGWSLVDGELEPGIVSVAVPLHGRDGSVVAAINISMSATNITEGALDRRFFDYRRELQLTVAEIEKEMRLI